MDKLAADLHLDVALIYYGIFLVALLVFLGVVGLARSRVERQSVRDLIGIIMAFLVLMAATVGFVVAEHALA